MRRKTHSARNARFVKTSGVLLAVLAAMTVFPPASPAQGWLPAGVWKGSFFREEDPKYQVHPVVATMDGSDRGVLDYPTLGCRAELNVFKVGDEARPFYNARMITGGDRCGDDFAIFFNEDGTAEYTQFTKKPGFSAVVVTGILKKQPPSRRARLAQYTAELAKKPPVGPPYLESRWQEMVTLASSLNPPPAAPDEANELFRKGNAHLGSYRYQEAMRAYNGALLLAPWLADVYYNLAVALEAAGEGSAAARPLELYLISAATKQEPQAVAAAVSQAAALLKAGEQKAAQERESEKPIKAFILKVWKQREELDREEERKKDEAASFSSDCSRDLTDSTYAPCMERKYELDELYESYDAFLKEHNRGPAILAKLREMAEEAYNRGDYATALRIWRPFAETDNSYAQFSLGWMYQHGEGTPEDLEEAARWYRLGAEGGNSEAQFRLAAMYFTGKGMAKDVKAAASWYRKSAEQGNAKAQLALGFMLSNDYGFPLDMAEAVRWIRKSAEQGHAQAQFTLGTMHHFGEGMTRDNEEAARWYRKAAEQDHASAQNNLAYMYENGEGVEKDLAEALKLYRRCSASGDEKCADKVKELEKH